MYSVADLYVKLVHGSAISPFTRKRVQMKSSSCNSLIEKGGNKNIFSKQMTNFVQKLIDEYKRNFSSKLLHKI